MKILRPIMGCVFAIAMNVTGFAMTTEELLPLVRQEMRRLHTDQERASYRGITRAAMTGVKYEELFNVANAEELILAEEQSIILATTDHPGKPYLFAAGRGLIASFNDEYVKAADLYPRGKSQAAEWTLEELDAKYKATVIDNRPGRNETEEYLNFIAVEVIQWSRSLGCD